MRTLLTRSYFRCWVLPDFTRRFHEGPPLVAHPFMKEFFRLPFQCQRAPFSSKLCFICNKAKNVRHLSLRTAFFRSRHLSSPAVRQKSTLSSFLVPKKNKDEKTSKTDQIHLSEFKRLIGIAKPEKWTLANALILLSFSSAVTMLVPFALGHVIDIIYTGEPTLMKERLNSVCLGLFFVFATGGLANFGRVYLMNIAGQRITRSLRALAFQSIIKQEIAFFDTTRTGELINRLSADTTLVSQSVTMNISDGLRSTVMVGAGISMMFYMSPQLAIVGLSIVPPVALLAITYGKYVKNITKRLQDNLAEATQVAEERISNIRTVRAFSQESKEILMYNKSIDNVLTLSYKEALARGLFFGMTGVSGNIIILSVLYYGGTLVTESSLSVGHLSSFLLYAAYVGIAMGGLSSFYSEMNKGLGASTRLFQLIDRVPAIPSKGGDIIPDRDLRGSIAFDKVGFCYPSRPQHKIFRGLSLAVPEGSVLAVVGSSGSGKSTVGSLLLRLYDPQDGDVSIDGKSIKSLDPAWLRSVIGNVSQDPILFSTSILENILYGSLNPDDVSLNEVKEAAREANALSFIEGFPQGFDTIVGERGVMLSGGQKQRIAIARALISNPKILLLDEATSALDAESESLVQSALERLMAGRTVITIAHRLSTIRNADQIAVLQDGQIVEAGTYDELYQKQDGTFRKLVERQMIPL